MGFTVGKLALNAAVNVETVRFYEKKGLMPKPVRKDSGYRVYSEQDVARLLFIRRAKELGFSLREIRELLLFRVDSKPACRSVQNLAGTKIRDIEKRIVDLQRIKKRLEQLKKMCESGSRSKSSCPILDALEV